MLKPPIELLYSFYIFAKTGDIVKSAKILHIGQPALTIRLQKIDEYFDSSLFLTKGRKKELSMLGSELLKSVKARFEDLDAEIESCMKKQVNPDYIRPLKIGIRPELVDIFFKKVSLKGQLEFVFSSASDIADELKKGTIDCGLSYYRPNSSQVIAKEIFISNTILAIPKKYIFLRKNLLKENMLKTPFIMYQNNDTFLNWYKKYKIEIHEFDILHTCQNWVSMCALINSGTGFALIPDWAICYLNLEKVDLISAPEIKPIKYYFLYRTEIKSLINYL